MLFPAAASDGMGEGSSRKEQGGLSMREKIALRRHSLRDSTIVRRLSESMAREETQENKKASKAVAHTATGHRHDDDDDADRSTTAQALVIEAVQDPLLPTSFGTALGHCPEGYHPLR